MDRSTISVLLAYLKLKYRNKVAPYDWSFAEQEVMEQLVLALEWEYING